MTTTGLICLYVYKIVDISILVKGDAIDVTDIDYDRRTQELSNAPPHKRERNKTPPV